MADLTASDFMVLAEADDGGQSILDMINADRTSKVPPLPLLEKNPSLTKGDVRSPAPMDSLYAHNFLNVIDWYVLFNMFRYTGSYASTKNIFLMSIPYFAYLSRLNDFFRTYDIYWTKFDIGNLVNRSMFVNGSQMEISNDNTGSYVLEILPKFPSSSQLSGPTIPFWGNLDSSLFYQLFSDFDSKVSSFKEGCFYSNNARPSVYDWGQPTHSSYDNDDPQNPPGPSNPPSSDMANGYSRRIEYDGRISGEERMNDTAYDPSSYTFSDIIAINSRFVDPTQTRTLKNAREIASYSILVCAEKSIHEKNGQYYQKIASKLSTKLYDPVDLGTIYPGQGNDTAAYFSPDSTKMTAAFKEVTNLTTMNISDYTSGNEYDIWLVTNVSYFIFVRPDFDAISA